MATSLYPSPQDWRDIWMYMILVDRFNNPAAPPAGGVPWDQPYPGDYRGGTLGGVQARLDYLQQLGAKAIWLSPVLKNCSYLKTYHGYGIQDFTVVEPRFTADAAATRANPDLGRQELRSLIDAAHARGMYVILDIVLNHTGDVFAYPGGAATAAFSSTPYTIEWRDAQGNPHPEWPQPPPSPVPDAVVWPAGLQHSEYFTRQGMARDTVGDFFDLKQLNTVYQDGDHFPVRDALITAYADIIRTYDIDGFRVDTLKYLAGNTPLVFGNAMREVALTLGKRNFFTFGEVYDSEDTVSRFIGRLTSMPGDDPSVIGIDAALDYPLFYVLPGVAKGLAPPSSLSDMYNHRIAVQDGLLSSHGEASRYYVSFSITTTKARGSTTRITGLLTHKCRSRSRYCSSRPGSRASTTAPRRGSTAPVATSRSARRCGEIPTPSTLTCRSRKRSSNSPRSATPTRRSATAATTSARSPGTDTASGPACGRTASPRCRESSTTPKRSSWRTRIRPLPGTVT